MANGKAKAEAVEHTFGPVFTPESEVLILGSFPSVRSREVGFYYGHPQNRFWKVIGALFGGPVPDGIPERIAWLHERKIALWDVIGSCEIVGSSDTSIRAVKPNDFSLILNASPIRVILCNGATAGKLFRKYRPPEAEGIPVFVLPSTSPANAAHTLPRLTEEWGEVLAPVRRKD